MPLARAKRLPSRKIAIAVNKIHRHRQGAQGGGDLLMQRIGIVIANPGFKQIAQNVKRLALLRFTLQKMQKTGSNCRFFLTQMEICDKQRARHYSLTVTFWMTTSSVGTS